MVSRFRLFPLRLLAGLLANPLNAQPQPESTRMVVHTAANDANRYAVRAELVGRDRGVVAQVPLSFTGTTSEYKGIIPVSSEGAAQLQVPAADGVRANVGTVRVPLNSEAE